MQIYRRFSTVKAITFDLDDTLYDNQPVIQKVEREMMAWLHQHHPMSANYTMQQWKELKGTIVQNSPELRHNVTAWRHAQIEQGLKIQGYDAALAKKAANQGIEHALWLRNQVDVPVESHQLLEKLAVHFPLIAITNGNVDVNKIGLGGYFDLVLQAGVDGRSKPYADMFSAAANHLKLRHHQILHVGDNLVTDVSGAKRCGFSACWVNSPYATPSLPEHTSAVFNVLPDIEVANVNELSSFI